MTDAISLKEAAAIFGVDSHTFTSHVRPHLVERRFGRRPRFSRAECEELWRQGGPVKPAPKGRARPPYLAPVGPPGVSAAERWRQAPTDPKVREAMHSLMSLGQRVRAGVASPAEVVRFRRLEALKVGREAALQRLATTPVSELTDAEIGEMRRVLSYRQRIEYGITKRREARPQPTRTKAR